MSGFRVCAKRCDQCLFSNAKIVEEPRKRQIISDCARKDTHFVCHKFTIAEGPDSNVCCRAFFDLNPHGTNLMRIAHRLGAVQFVDLPNQRRSG